MVRTAEARWFFAGRPTRARIDWFKGGAEVRREPQRVDRYLVGAGVALGVKLRQGKLELKALAAPPRSFRVASAAGLCDEWVKWSLPLKEAPRLGRHWVPIAKARLLLEQPACNVELASIRAFGRRYLSLGFEAQSRAALDRALARFFGARAAFPGARVTLGRSLSYPAWLAAAAPASSRARKRPSRARRRGQGS